MAARIDKGHAQLRTRTGLDWTDKYPSAIVALADVEAKTAYIGYLPTPVRGFEPRRNA